MKPSVMNAAGAGNGSGSPGAPNGITIPVNHEYGAQQQQRQSPHFHYQQQQQPQPFADASGGGSGFAGQPTSGRQFPAHFQQDFGFDPGMDDMFSRSRLGRMHDPFAAFGTRKRCGNDPQPAAPDGFSHYFNDDPDFDFPQFGTLGRRRAAAAAGQHPIDPHAARGYDDHDFFNRLPSEFRQYIPETFGHSRRSAAPSPPSQANPYWQNQPQQQQQYYGSPNQAPSCNNFGAHQSKTLCDAAMQTDGAAPGEQLNQHSLRNTIDMGVKSSPETAGQHRAHSAPPTDQQPVHTNGKRASPPPTGQHGTQSSPQAGAQSQPFHKAYYAPQQHAHAAQQQQPKQQTPPPPQTPGGTYVRTIPIFVEGRSEPIINSHKEIPTQNAASGANTSSTGRTHAQPPQQHPPQQHRPTPLNTQQQQQQPKPAQQGNGAAGSAGPAGPPQTPHTMDSINKIQDIQRDVLDLMGKVEKFGGKRQDKEYVYLDEMLTRNLLKLDTIDTNGKDSIRLARKEAIKCIQASINVLEAKAEENARLEAAAAAAAQKPEAPAEEAKESKAAATKEGEEPQQEAEQDEAAAPADANKSMEAIPLPPPEGVQVASSNSNSSVDKNNSNNDEQPKEQPTKEASPQRQEEAASATAAE